MAERIAPPMRISVKGWWTWRDISKREAEAYHYRCAAVCAESGDRFGVQEHLKEAQRNYHWSTIPEVKENQGG
jgi:hypothetical protein